MTRGLLKPYPSTVNSGVDELGDVPHHWEVRQLGRMGRFSKGRGGTKEDETAEGVPCVRYGDLYTRHDYFIQRARSNVPAEKAESYEPTFHGDVLFAGSGETIEEIGKSAVNLMKGPAVCGGDVIIFRPFVSVDPTFLGLATDCLQAVLQKSRMGRGITVMHIYADELKYLSVALPPQSEQPAIVRYLGYVGRRVKALIRGKRKLIALLSEQKQAIIHQAVTGGLDPEVRLKDSGVEWLGKVPAHWRLNRGKYYFREVDVRSATGEEELLSVSHITGVTPRSQKNITMFKAETYVGSKVCAPGQIAVNTMWAWMAAMGVSRFNGLVSPAYHVYAQIDSDAFADQYLDVLLRSQAYKTQYTINSTGITASRLRLYPDDFLRIRFLCPPREEQAAILQWLNDATASADAAISRALREIELLDGFRTRLVSDVVTGKLDVREAAAELPGVDSLEAEDDLEDTFEVEGVAGFDATLEELGA